MPDSIADIADELYEALAEQVAECFDPACEMCARHEAILAKAKAANLARQEPSHG